MCSSRHSSSFPKVVGPVQRSWRMPDNQMAKHSKGQRQWNLLQSFAANMGLFIFPAYSGKGCRAKNISGRDDIRSIMIIIIIVKIIVSLRHLFKLSTFNRINSVMLVSGHISGQNLSSKAIQQLFLQDSQFYFCNIDSFMNVLFSVLTKIHAFVTFFKISPFWDRSSLKPKKTSI